MLLLARHFLRRFAGQLGRREIVMVPAVERLLLRYPWPGNVRELQNVIERAVHLLEDDILLPEHLRRVLWLHPPRVEKFPSLPKLTAWPILSRQQ